MALTIHPINDDFAAEIGDIDLVRIAQIPSGRMQFNHRSAPQERQAASAWRELPHGSFQQSATAKSGRPALYLNTGRMEGIEGLDPDEAFALINTLYAHATRPIYEYRHKWRAGDMVIWDNRSVMHQANADYEPEEFRFLYRVMLKGAKLVPAFNRTPPRNETT